MPHVQMEVFNAKIVVFMGNGCFNWKIDVFNGKIDVLMLKWRCSMGKLLFNGKIDVFNRKMDV